MGQNVGDERSREWAIGVMRKYHFLPSAIERIDSLFDFRVADWHSSRGGGRCWWPSWDGKRRGLVECDTAQEESCVHESSHAFLESIYVDSWELAMRLSWWIINAFDREADRPQEGKFGPVRHLLHGYKYGIRDWPGMAVAEEHRWNGLPWNVMEVHAGLCSFLMGDMSKLPPSLWHTPAVEWDGTLGTVFNQQFYGPPLRPVMGHNVYMPHVGKDD